MIFQQPEETNENILSLHFQRKFPAQEPEDRLEMNLKNLLYNEVTALPTLPVMFQTIQSILNKQGQMGFLYINIVQYSMLEQIYGWRKFDFFMKELAESLVKIKKDFLRKNDAICEVMIKGSSFLLILSPARTKRVINIDDLGKICIRIGKEFNSELKRRVGQEIFQKLGCYFGYSVLEDDTTQRIERLVYNTIAKAHESSKNQEQKDVKRRSAMLHNIVLNKKIYTVYQPILDFQTKNIIGYEALNRGPKGEFENPDFLFRLAYENNAVWSLDRLCQLQALRGFAHMNGTTRIFINVEPTTFDDPQFFIKEPLAILKDANITPEQVVLELTERRAIENFNRFRELITTFKNTGFKVAVDDLGTGYSGLQLLSELLPDYVDYVKIDMSFIRDIANHNSKQEIISFLLKLTRDTDTQIIVEGIECKQELHTIRALGVNLAQGFLLASPHKIPQSVPPAVFDI